MIEALLFWAAQQIKPLLTVNGNGDTFPHMLPDSDREEAAAAVSKTDNLVVPPKKMSSALGSLVANYGSMTESDSDEEPEGEFASILKHDTICA